MVLESPWRKYYSMPKETEARLMKKCCSLNKERHCLSYLSRWWWSALRHIFKTLKSVIKTVVNYISFGGNFPSMVFVLKSDSHTCVFT